MLKYSTDFFLLDRMYARTRLYVGQLSPTLQKSYSAQCFLVSSRGGNACCNASMQHHLLDIIAVFRLFLDPWGISAFNYVQGVICGNQLPLIGGSLDSVDCCCCCHSLAAVNSRCFLHNRSEH